jgi:hypothetical protein
VAGRVLGYLMICQPPEQTIDELGKALLASRSAITGAVSLLTRCHVRRSMIDEGAAFYEFLAERMPALLTEWHAQRNYPGTGR